MKIKFQKQIRSHRKKLREAGYHPSTIHTWEYGKRMPMFKTALKLSTILDMPLSDIPYRRVEVNRP